MKQLNRALTLLARRRRHPTTLAVLGLVATCALLVSKDVKASQLLTNGGFETPAEPVVMFHHITPGTEPAGFGWTVGMDSVEVVRQGYVGGGGTLLFNGPAYEGLQWLDLDGYPNPGSISQTFATTAGTQYELSFAYANNPYNRIGPALATVYVRDSISSTDLMTPLPIAHGTATGSDYDWTFSGPLYFIAQGSNTRLSFVSANPSGDSGIFLDAISVVPEPGSFVLLAMGAAMMSWSAVRRRRR